MIGVHIKEGKFEHRNMHRRKLICREKMAIYKPRREAWNRSSEGSNPADTVTLDFKPSEP